MNRKIFRIDSLSVLWWVLIIPAQGIALSISDSPLFLPGSVVPLVMLDVSKDHQLYYKAYNDFSDLNGDSVVDVTYSDVIDYYGYFDSKKCYSYSTTNNRFAPGALATGANNHYCSSSYPWSGNFLNWATMTRMDAVRKMLYGGMRSTDTATLTVLERSFLPTEAHSFAKYYNGADIASLTPFTTTLTTPPSAASTSSVTIGSGSKTFNTSLSVAVGDQVLAYVTSNQANQWMVGGVSSKASGTITLTVPVGSLAGTGTSAAWTLQNLSKTGITFCNLTPGATSGANQYSQTNTNPPIIRVANGNFALWNANEVWQCYWSEEGKTNTAGFLRNGNMAYFSGIYASAADPSQVTHGLGSGTAQAGASSYSATAQGQYVVRVEACNSALIGQERCKQYGTSYKPIGLLQQYGDTNQLQFGLMTGSYTKNISGGVLRSNMGNFSGEVSSSNGTFNSTAYGIVYNINKLRLYGYNYGTGIYNTASSSGGDDCTYQQIGFVFSGGANAQGSAANQGNCSSWGNPMAEIYLESLRYLAGRSATSAFTYTSATGSSATKDDKLGLKIAAWANPITSANYCAPINVLNFNASVSSRDNDQMSGITDLGTASTANALTTTVGGYEGIDSASWFIGSNGTANNLLCSAKAGSPGLGAFLGLCPEAPTQQGTYLMSGAAFYAKTNRIRSDLTVPTGAAYANSLKASTYGIALASNVPKIQVTVGSGTVTILPAYRLDRSSTGVGPFGGGTLVDFKIISKTETSGKFYVNWEDSEQGGDYDQDMWGIIQYAVSGDTITVTTQAVSASTANGQGFGYIISGTNQDGPHFHSGIYNFDYTDLTSIVVTPNTYINSSGGCSNCVVGTAATSATYTVGSSSASLLNDPLWYAAKYGGFSDSNSNARPDLVSEWDTFVNNTGLPGQDGIPDNFFYVIDPLNLEKGLNTVFLRILREASSSGLATNSTSLNTGSRVYQGRFSNNAWTGELLSYRLDSSGNLMSASAPPSGWDTAVVPWPEWEAGQKISALVDASSDTRLILTKGANCIGSDTPPCGVDFQYANLSTSQRTSLNQNTSSTVDNCGLERLAYLRGQSSREGTGTFSCASGTTIPMFRPRTTSKLGDIINSAAAYSGIPAAGYNDVQHPGYSAFRTLFKNRTPMVYVGANDGMLHGFDASVDSATNTPTSNSGNELIAYIPSPVYGSLSRLTDSNYKALHKYFVDGTPMVADACFSSCGMNSSVWKTVLIGGLGAGGAGFYALNVTNPNDVNNNSVNTPMFTVENAANILLWEFTQADDGDLGYAYNTSSTQQSNGQAKQIVKFENDAWGVVVGNGYNSPNGKAVLYVLFVAGPGADKAWQAGTEFVKILADAPVSPATPNGLSTPTPVDSDGNGLVDTVYAGDIKGNIWKFNLSSANPASWGLTYTTPLFSAVTSGGVAQPVTVPPEVSRFSAGGWMVLVGTGKFIESADSTSTTQQTFYGIYDDGVHQVTRSQLSPQTITTTTPTNGTAYRTVSPGCGSSPLAACPSPFRGWYVDLPVSGERAVGAPKLISGTIFFNTFIPSSTPCDFGGTGWLMGLDYSSGGIRAFNVFDTNGNGSVNAYDIASAGLQVGAAVGGSTLIKGTGSAPGSGSGSTGGGGGGAVTVYSGSGAAIQSLTTGAASATAINFGSQSQGRLTWREIPQ